MSVSMLVDLANRDFSKNFSSQLRNSLLARSLLLRFLWAPLFSSVSDGISCFHWVALFYFIVCVVSHEHVRNA